MAKKIRVGILAYDLTEARGGTKLALTLGNQLKKAGCEVAYSCVYEKIKEMEKFFGEKYDFSIYKPKRVFIGNKIVHYTALYNHRKPTLDLIKEFKPDIIIEIGGIITSLFPAIQKKIPTIHYCVVPVSSYVDYNKYKINILQKIQLRFFKNVERFFVKRINVLAAMSGFTQKIIKDIWNAESEIIYPPIKVKDFKATKKKNIILCIARYDPVYKLEEVIEIYRKLKRKEYELHFTSQLSEKDIHYYSKIKSMIKKDEKVFLHNDLSSNELVKLYQKSKIFIYPSWSPYGLIFVEAQASGIPVIAVGKGSGASEILLDKKSGYIVDNISEIYEKLSILIKNKKLWNEMSKQAVKNAARFDVSVFRNKFIKIIKEILRKI
ncbi:MAG: glycosyltransferase family 4 protein [Nanoarchaeota archaeon]|nr:glycosyltransferase family 4 protein [Nanoarchaeota archaeon]